MASGTSPRYPFSTGRVADWTYFTWTTRTNADGSTTVTVNYRMRHTYWLMGTWSFYMTCNGVRKEFRKYFYKMDDTPVDVLIGSTTFTIAYGQYSASNPKAIPVTIDTTINGYHINNGGNKLMGRSTGTSNVSSDLWRAPKIEIATIKVQGTDSIEVKAELDNNPGGLYLIEIELLRVGTSTKYSKTSTRGAISLSNVFSGLLPYTQYSATIRVSELRHLVSGNILKHLAGVYTPDTAPRVTTPIRISEVGLNSMRATIGVSSNTNLKYEFRVNGGSWVESTSNTKVFTGLTQNTEYTIEVKVTNAGGSITESASATTKFSPPSVPTLAITGIGNTTAKATAKSSSVVGIRTYQLSMDGGRTYSLASTSGVFDLTNLSPGTAYKLIARAVDSQNFSTPSEEASFRTTYLPPKLLSATLKPMSSKSALLTISAEAQAGIESYNISPTAPATLRGASGATTMIYTSTAGGTIKANVSVTDKDSKTTNVVEVSAQLPEDTITEVMTNSVPVRFVRNTTDILKTVKLVDGQILLDIVSGALYSDINPRGTDLERILLQPAREILMTRVTDATLELYTPSADGISYVIVPGSVFNLKLASVAVGSGRLAVRFGNQTYEVYEPMNSATAPIGVKDVYVRSGAGYLTIKFIGDRMVRV